MSQGSKADCRIALQFAMLVMMLDQPTDNVTFRVVLEPRERGRGLVKVLALVGEDLSEPDAAKDTDKYKNEHKGQRQTQRHRQIQI